MGATSWLSNWLFADADATFTRAHDRETGEAVALAPTRTLTAGIGARPTIGRFTPFLGLRLKSIAERPASEDREWTAEGFTVVDANLGLRFGEPEPVTGIHYVPGWPRTVMARASLYWR